MKIEKIAVTLFVSPIVKLYALKHHAVHCAVVRKGIGLKPFL